MNTTTPILLPLASADASLEVVGGKARSLARLAVAGLPVPGGFLLTTTAYKIFVADNNLQESIFEAVSAIATPETAAQEAASARIRSLFQSGTVPPSLVASIAAAYQSLEGAEPAVAVRSSATAEDLPDWSFAGLQDTCLNVRGLAALLEAVRQCWASTWTARAIGYRTKMQVDHRSVSMGVIVQRMVDADVSGILFTANPASGDRSELIVNASYGLGESIVGGQVTPDTYILDRDTLQIKNTTIGGKHEMIVPAAEQGTATKPVPESQRSTSSLSQKLLAELAALSLRAEELAEGVPQDIEWAVAQDRCWLLQSRPITNLPPQPASDVCWDPPTRGTILVRRQVVENMPEPLSPLFDELYLRIGLEKAIDQLMLDFGFRFDADVFLERPMFLTVNGYAYCRGSYRFSWRLVRVMPLVLYIYVRLLPRLLRNLINDWREIALPAYKSEIDQWQSVQLDAATDNELMTGIRELAVADAQYWFRVAVLLGAAKVTDDLLNRFLTSRFVPGQLTSGALLRGFPSKTIESQAVLEKIAARIGDQEQLRELVLNTPAGELLQSIQHEPGGPAVAEDIHRYLRQYGHQVYNLDFVQPTQMENPLPVMSSLKSLVINPRLDTPARQAAIVQARDAQVEQTLSTLGPLRRWLFRKLLRWAQKYNPYREEALFYMGAAWPTLRRLARELGRRLVEGGMLDHADDVFYLQSDELENACRARDALRAVPHLKDRVAQQRGLREARQRLHPPGILPPGSRWKIGFVDFSMFETQKRNQQDASTLKGFAVSPGKVTGPASVIRSPEDFERMKPDTILVCPTTTPAWTPLFAQALGLVTDIGGILAHGSIVAREYDIPAVLGTGNATRRIVNGQRITVDGDTGTVTILEQP